MTRSIIELRATPEDHRIARMAAVAVGLALVEAGIPSPIPGVKPGLANIVVLLVLARFGWREAAWVSLLRVVGGSLMLGSFLTPGFFLSLSGAAASLAALAAARLLPVTWFGPVSWSIIAAFAHLAGQLAIVYGWLIPHAGILYLVPVLSTAALGFGLVNGLIAARLLGGESLGTRVPQPIP
jgi:heptaprenyl diphosphate synthase